MAVERIVYLRMDRADDLHGPRRDVPAFVFEPLSAPARHRALYRQVGARWCWTDRLDWSLADWHAHGANPAVAVWVARVGDRPIGFIELDGPYDGAVEIAYFGLLPDWIGAGHGAAVLSAGVEQAWQRPGVDHVWLHTGHLDHPRALANYLDRGFRVSRVACQRAPT